MNMTPHPVTLRQLQYVVAVADRRSFRRAADDCRVAQPSLSAQVAQVESQLGLRLFERDRRTVTPTAAGQAFVERARALLLGADALVESARALADPFSGTLRIGVIPTIGPYLLPEVAPALRTRFPRLVFVWAEERTGVLVEKLGRGELDAAIVALESELGDLPHLVIGKDPFVFAADPAHPLAAGRRPLRPADLEGAPVLVLEDGHCFREQALSFCTRAGAEEASWRATSLATLVQMAAGGAGVTLLPSLAVPVENRHHALAIRPFASPGPVRTLALVWRKGFALETAARTVGEALRDAYGRFVNRPPPA
jgi:LysR family hydrogen peroxide-inducible transcriptional activator